MHVRSHYTSAHVLQHSNAYARTKFFFLVRIKKIHKKTLFFLVELVDHALQDRMAILLLIKRPKIETVHEQQALITGARVLDVYLVAFRVVLPGN